MCDARVDSAPLPRVAKVHRDQTKRVYGRHHVPARRFLSVRFATDRLRDRFLSSITFLLEETIRSCRADDRKREKEHDVGFRERPA